MALSVTILSILIDLEFFKYVLSVNLAVTKLSTTTRTIGLLYTQPAWLYFLVPGLSLLI